MVDKRILGLPRVVGGIGRCFASRFPVHPWTGARVGFKGWQLFRECGAWQVIGEVAWLHQQLTWQ
jgi:hypothetical protein